MKYIYTVFLFLLAISNAFAQTVTLKGTITDQSGHTIPFSSIYIKGTTKGTSANSEGVYQLQLNPGNYDVVFKAIGYHTESRVLNLKNDQTVNVTLASESYQLHDVVINSGGEDPAYAIIRKTIKKRAFYLKQVNAYSCEVYIKGLQKLLAAPKKFLGRDIDKIARENGLDSNRKGIIYLSESESKLTFMQPTKYTRK